MPDLSVIICAHNPRPDYLRSVLGALKTQTLPKEQWELLLIDNASKEPLADKWDLSWQPNARHICEDELGLTPARLCGIKESKGELLVFVDDDNALSETYLDRALKIAADFPQLGSFGAGKITPDFEANPDPEVAPFIGFLALRDEKEPSWANHQRYNSATPWGAGLCILHSVALLYSEAVSVDGLRRSLGRAGQGLLSGEDVDMALFACKSGRGTGVFPQLSLTHLIPLRRLKRQYVASVAEGHAASQAILAYLWGYQADRRENPLAAWLRHLRHSASLKGMARDVYLAERRGRLKARHWLASLK
jgi:glycosyltransferase involved in cell wall biosynthesis